MAALFADQPGSAQGRSPFQPGRGKLPPYLAGREREQALIRESLEAIAEQDAPASDIVLYGPRGNGKTVLIEWSRRQAEALKIRVADLQGGSLKSDQQVSATLPAAGRWLARLRNFKVGPFGVGLRRLPHGPDASILARSVGKKPFLILIDEAHMLGVETGRALLNTVQALQRRDLPVLLILAGTPDLPRHLGTMGASFWDRSEQLPVGRLKPTAAADAIRVPFEERGRSIDDEALQQVVRESHSYPFFLQVWGTVLWRNCPDPAAPISLADIDRTRPLFRRRQELYYDRRLDELARAGLVSVAARVAAEFSSDEQVPRERVTVAIRAAMEREGLGRTPDAAVIREAERFLRHCGYIWPVVRRGIGCYEPGIPSLMRHVTLNDRKNREIGDEIANEPVVRPLAGQSSQVPPSQNTLRAD